MIHPSPLSRLFVSDLLVLPFLLPLSARGDGWMSITAIFRGSAPQPLSLRARRASACPDNLPFFSTFPERAYTLLRRGEVCGWAFLAVCAPGILAGLALGLSSGATTVISVSPASSPSCLECRPLIRLFSSLSSTFIQATIAVSYLAIFVRFEAKGKLISHPFPSPLRPTSTTSLSFRTSSSPGRALASSPTFSSRRPSSPA
jgi:hypothetical protein